MKSIKNVSSSTENCAYHVHIGFGFHVNCYHSYRGDTPDALGFGSDIRIIRHIIETLDGWNQKGVPVKGTWDFENAYSIEQILPEYAPDILENIRRRQAEDGDENILMGYNNGAMSAMTEDEFLASISRAVTNEQHSGLKDVFGGCEMIIRPQEVMFNPAQTALYKKAGVTALCLYYSCVPFDAFRTLIPQLDDEAAFNPLTYTYKDDTITIMPTYSHSDIMDAGTLRWLVSDLHEKQVQGTINQDVFLFINIDADSFLWEPLPVPEFLTKNPNMGGLNGLISETCDLDFVKFDTVGNYLKHHAPVRNITFGQDVADGNFSGYSSWAEKPFNRQIWTRLERARAIGRINGADATAPSFDKRIRLLSTTHFGLASPVLNLTREQTALRLSKEMLEEELAQMPKGGDLILKCEKPQALFSTQLSLEKGFCRNIRQLAVCAEGLKHFAAVPMSWHEDESVSGIYLVCVFEEKITQCAVKFDLTDIAQNDRKSETAVKTLHTGTLSVGVDEKNGFPVLLHGEKVVASTQSFIHYKKDIVPFEKPSVALLEMAGEGVGIRFFGEIHLPEELTAGHYRFDFFTVPGVDSLLVNSEVQYPYTKEQDEISSQASNLGRFTDNQWTEVSPLAFSMEFSDDAKVMKRNFMGDMTDFPVSDFWNSFAENENIDSFNHQLTGGILCMADKEHGLAVAHARNVLGSMAHCPMRLQTAGKKRILTMNAFGTYYGKQRYYPTRGNGCVMGLYNSTMPQAQSLAPAYNGFCEQSVQALNWMAGNLSEPVYEELAAIADGVVGIGGTKVTGSLEDNVERITIQKSEQPKGGLSFFSGSSKTEMVKAGVALLQNMYCAKKKLKALNRNK